MLEMILNPRNHDRGPIKMFFVGLLYASLSLLLVHWFFGNDPTLSRASGMIVITFCIMFSLPYMYYLFKQEEEETELVEGFFHVWRVHKDAIFAFMWLFVGFVVAFAFWNLMLQNPNLLNFQIETYCQINEPGNVINCVDKHAFITGDVISMTGQASSKMNRFLGILENNVYVMIFTLIFSLVFGAGAIFILAWNASVIAAAIGIFTKNQIAGIPLGLGRYMIHGFPEIAAYFVTALAGGIFGAGVLRNGIRNRRFIRILENSFLLLFLSIIILVIAAAMEVYLTPLLF
jgi:uncharacterized membrane protein SpoIIM required for sporulation